MGTDHKGVIHTMKPTEGLDGCLIQYLLPEIPTQKLVINRGDNSISTPSVHSQNWPPKLKKEQNRPWHNSVSSHESVYPGDCLRNWHYGCQIMLKLNMIFFGQIQRVQHADELGNIPHKGVSILTTCLDSW